MMKTWSVTYTSHVFTCSIYATMEWFIYIYPICMHDHVLDLCVGYIDAYGI